ncbi:NAD(P)-dependent oxidoreductase [Oerskovia sp. NPDC057915]|uniref:NAD(P)-dependent oxidoreductase n=1 Tax=Oerskovia sp. NPDC057915 TaxID=3346280 RepID=UPI0036D8C70E
MKIVVLGATGNLGSQVVEQAVAAGHEVVAYARRPEAVPTRPGVSVVGGALDDSSALADAVRGADVVVSAVGGPAKDRTFMQRVLPTIVAGLEEAGVDRFVLVSAFGVGDTATKASWFARLVYRTVISAMFADKAASEAILPTSPLRWTIACPVNLKDAPALASETVKPLDEVGAVPGLPTLPFANAGRALVEIASNPEYVGERVLVTTPTGWRAASR